MTIRVPLVIVWVACAVLFTAPVQADSLFGLYGGAGTWQQLTTGSVASGSTDIDIDKDLGLEDELNNVFYLAVEHPLPGVPNLRLQYADVAVAGDNALTRTIEFNGQVFNFGEGVVTEVALTQTDVVLYYGLLDKVVSLDVGLAARLLDGNFALASDSGMARARFKDTMPMLYGRARTDLPLSGFWLGAEIMGLGFRGNDILDANAQIGWESSYNIGAEAGWRAYRLDMENMGDVDRAGIDLSGPYFAVSVHF